MSTSDRFRTPSPRYPTPSPTSLSRLLATWERLRALDIEGYRTSAAEPMSTWLLQINWAEGKTSSQSRGRGTTCSPFTTQSVAMAYSPGNDAPLAPALQDGEPLPLLFSLSANSNLKPAHQASMDRYGMTFADNGWPRPIVFFNMGFAIEPTRMRRGDAVHIDWATGGGHAVFCWDVHLDQNGDVDAFQFLSSNGLIAGGGAGAGVSVGGTPLGSGGFIRQVSANPIRYQPLRDPLFVDDDRYVAEGTWVTWKPGLTIADLADCRVRPRGKLRLAKTVLAARFHGVQAPDPYAMGAGAAAPQIAAVRPAQPTAQQDDASPTDGQLWVERRLKMLYEIGWLDVDNGDPDRVNDAQTQAAVRAFQGQYGLKADGIAGPKTRAKLRETYEQAAASAEGMAYLSTGAGVRGAGAAAPAPADRDGQGQGQGVILDFYFRHGTASPGQEVSVVLRARGLDGQRFSLKLRDETSGQVLDAGAVVTIDGGVGRATVKVPAGLAGPLTAIAEGAGVVTAAPLYLS